MLTLQSLLYSGYNRVSTHLKYLSLTPKNRRSGAPARWAQKSTILASTSVRSLSFIAMKLPLHPENRLNTVSPFSAVETCSSQLCFPHLEDVHRSFHTAAGLLLRSPNVEPSKATFSFQALNFDRIDSKYKRIVCCVLLKMGGVWGLKSFFCLNLHYQLISVAIDVTVTRRQNFINIWS